MESLRRESKVVVRERGEEVEGWVVMIAVGENCLFLTAEETARGLK